MVNYPILVEYKKRQGVRYNAQFYLDLNYNDPEFKELDRVEDILQGEKDCLVYFIEMLMQKNLIHQAKGIYERNNLQESDFEILNILNGE